MSANPQGSMSPPPDQQSTSNLAGRLRNFLIVLVAAILTIALFLGLRTETPSTALSEMAEASTPLEVALSNGKPTFMEFYANWCTSCQAMAKDLSEIKQEYSERMNFVMLNVDNNKWLPEILKYRVDGIPHFVYFDNKGTARAQTIGEMPREIIASNLEALIAGQPLPHAQETGQVSSFKTPVAPAKDSATDPRSHGSQVQ